MSDIEMACESFRKILEEQIRRIENMNGEKTDFSTKKTILFNHQKSIKHGTNQSHRRTA